MRHFAKSVLAVTASAGAVLALWATAPQAATNLTRNTDNVTPGTTPPDGETGASIVNDRDPAAPAAQTTGRIVVTLPEAVSPGIKVEQENDNDSGPSDLQLDGCTVTSSGAT